MDDLEDDIDLLQTTIINSAIAYTEKMLKADTFDEHLYAMSWVFCTSAINKGFEKIFLIDDNEQRKILLKQLIEDLNTLKYGNIYGNTPVGMA